MAHLGAVFAIIEQIHTTKNVATISLPNCKAELKELLQICESLDGPLQAAIGSISDTIKMLERTEERQRMLDERQAVVKQQADAMQETASQPKGVSSYAGRAAAAAASITQPLQEKIIIQPDSRIPVARKNFMTEMFINNTAVFIKSFRFSCKHETMEGGCNNGHKCKWTHSYDYNLAQYLRDGKYKCTPCI